MCGEWNEVFAKTDQHVEEDNKNPDEPNEVMKADEVGITSKNVAECFLPPKRGDAQPGGRDNRNPGG